MASKISIAIMIANARTRFRNNLPILAERFGVDAPDLDIPKRWTLDYRRALELERMSIFVENLAQLEHESKSDELDAIKAIVSKAQWTKQEIIDVLGAKDGR